MATIIQIRRRIPAGLGPQLAEGELAYAYDSDELFVGSDGAATNLLIGGASFISLLTVTPGVATADKAVILDSNAEIDAWGVTGQVTADSYKTSAAVGAGFVKNDASGNLLFGQTGEQSDLSLDNLADVTITSPVDGNVFQFDGSDWINRVDIELSSTAAVFLGDPAAAGTWRLQRSGTDLRFDRADTAGNFVTKLTVAI